MLAVCENRDFRLVGGTTDREGRVEVCMNGRWMAVCSNGWTEREAGLLCREMGHSSFGKRIIQTICSNQKSPFCFTGAEVRVFHPRRVPSTQLYGGWR